MIHGFRFLLLLLLPILLGCCRKDDPQPAIEQLPPATTTGANTFGCLVNGEVWKVTSTSTFGNRLVADWTVSDNLSILLSQDMRTSSRSIVFSLPDTSTTIASLTARPYLLSSVLGRCNARLDKAGAYYEQRHLVRGQLTLTRLDRTARICSGTFDFVMANGTDTIRVTDGRFDIRDMLL